MGKDFGGSNCGLEIFLMGLRGNGEPEASGKSGKRGPGLKKRGF